MMTVKCEKIQKTERYALVVRTRTPMEQLPQAIGAAYQQIGALMGEYSIQPADAPYVAYYNMDMQDLDIEIGFFFDKALEGRGDVKPVVYPAMSIASAMHKGPYDTLNVTYDALNAWIKEQGDEPTGVVFEFYLNSPQEVPPEEMLTRIEFILK
jgi:effector-binding domain-containing protein